MPNFSVAHGGRGNYPIAMGLYWKKRNKPLCDFQIIHEKNFSRIYRITLPDRVIYLGSGKLRFHLLEKKDQFDDFLYIDPWMEDESADMLGLKYYMGNFIGDSRTMQSKVRSIWDSGGLQIFKGRVDFIDPRKLGNAFKKANVYAGVTLDFLVPKVSNNYLKAVRLASTMQKRNTFLVGKHAGPNVKLLNVIHGYSEDARKIWLSNSLTGKYDQAWCLADLSRVLAVADRTKLIIQDICNLKAEVGDPKKLWLHLLGIALHRFITILIPLSTVVGRITADATTAIAAARHGLIILPPISGSFSFSIGRISGYQSMLIPCNCPICAFVGHSWVYSYFVTPLSLHNILVNNRWIETLSAVFANAGFDHNIKFLKYHKHPDNLIRLIRGAQEFLETDKSTSLDKMCSLIGATPSFSLYTPEAETRLWQVLKKYVEFYKGDMDE